MTEFTRSYRKFVAQGTAFHVPAYVRNHSPTLARFRRRVVETLTRRCPDCAPQECADCSAIFNASEEGIVVDNDPICQDCSDSYWYCEYHDTYHSNDDAVTVYDEGRNGRREERVTCAQDRARGYSPSWDGEYYPDDTLSGVYGHDGISTLDPQLEDLYECYECNILVSQDDAVRVNDDEICCPDCARSRCSYPLFSYHSSSRPRLRPVMARGQKTTHVTYGVEIETENPDGRDATLEACATADVGKTHKHFWCEEDGSLDEADGVEIVTQPHSLEAFREPFWKDFLGELQESGAVSWDSTACGQHVHVSRRAFQGALHQAKFVTFLSMSENLPFVEWMAGRREMTYAMRPPGADTNTVAQFGAGDKAKYRIVNLSHDSTIEFRLPKGTLNHRTFLKNVEFMDALRVYTQDAGIKRLGAQSFMDWMQGKRKQWPSLSSWMKDRAQWQPSDMPGELSLGRVAKLRVKKAEIKAELEGATDELRASLACLEGFTTIPPSHPVVGMRGITRSGQVVVLGYYQEEEEEATFPLQWTPGAVFTTTMRGTWLLQGEHPSDIVHWEIPRAALSESA